MRADAAQPQLRDTELSLLDTFLMSDRAAGSMGLSDLDGFLTGIIVGPEVIPPNEWLPAVWGGEMPHFVDSAEAQAMESIILDRYIDIVTQLDQGPEGLEPIFWCDNNQETVIADAWAAGFFAAIALRADAWKALLKDEVRGVLLAPILVLCEDEHGRSLLTVTKEEEAQWYIHAPRMIPASVLAIRDFWRQRACEAPLRQPDRNGREAECNGFCRCGSGRKYKYCYGAN